VYIITSTVHTCVCRLSSGPYLLYFAGSNICLVGLYYIHQVGKAAVSPKHDYQVWYILSKQVGLAGSLFWYIQYWNHKPAVWQTYYRLLCKGIASTWYQVQRVELPWYDRKIWVSSKMGLALLDIEERKIQIIPEIFPIDGYDWWWWGPIFFAFSGAQKISHLILILSSIIDYIYL